MIIVYKFNAEWNKNDASYNAIFDKVSKEFDKPEEIEFKDVDIDESPDLVNKYSIKFVPITLIEVNGEVKFKRVGIITEDDLRDEVNKAYNHLNKK
jgi:thiol-disulfide isomerase/thioredoxin